MKYALGNMLNGAGSLNPDGLSLDLQFATDKTLTARKGPTPVFTRASTATFVGSNGLIQSAAVNSPRFDHDPVTLASRGLLIEEGRTNLFARSEEFNIAPWGLLDATLSVNSTASPDGLETAEKLVVNSGVNNGRVAVTNTLTGSHTMSVFAKAAEWSWVFLAPLGPGSGVWFNISNGSLGTQSSGFVGAVTSLGNGWYRCAVTFTGAGASASSRIVATNSSGGLSTGDGTSGIFIWGAQLEAGAFPTSYIPTVASSVVRSADVCSITGANFTSFWNTNEGAMFASGDPRGGAGAATLVMANSGANSNQIAFDRTTTAIKFGIANSGSYTATIQQNSANASFVKIAGSYATNDARSALNGTLGTPDTSVIVPTNLVRFNIGSAGLANQEFANGCIFAIRYFRKPLSNAKLQTLTA